MSLIDGTRIATIIREAETNEVVRKRLYFCPEKIIEGRSDLSEAEAHALMVGDLSAIDLDEETLLLGRRLFTESPLKDVFPPPAGGLTGAAAHGIC